jgi:hypothetical protein
MSPYRYLREEGVLTEYKHRLIVIRLRLVAVERDVKEKVTMNLQRSKGSRKTTLGDLQRDQSEVRLSKSPSL